MADEGFGDLGSLSSGPIVDPEDAAESLLDRMLGEEVLDSPPGTHTIEPPDSQPVNQATMVCLRGPCMHYWTLTHRFYSLNKTIRPSVIRQCNYFVGEETQLGEQNVYSCGAWWPAWLAFVPESARPALRPHLVRLWEWFLAKRGYDFEWRWWDADAFESDRKGEREHSGAGYAPASFMRNRSSDIPLGGVGALVPEDD
jgi:hypothetical protein